MNQAVVEKTLGNFAAPLPNSKEYLTLYFSPTSAPRQERWRNYGLSADFLGDYFAAFFPGDEVPNSKINQRDTVKAAVSYIANELLENAIKFNSRTVQEPISIALYLHEHQILFQVVNYVDKKSSQNYQQFAQEILAADDIDQLYTQQLEKTAMGVGESKMGILTMMADYGARFAWKFQSLPQNSDIVQVDVLVYLDI
jgi:hypothetical protein